MTNTTLFYITSLTTPSLPAANCRQQSEISFTPPKIDTKAETFSRNFLTYSVAHYRNNVNKNHPDFWTTRIVFHTALSDTLFSVSFFLIDSTTDGFRLLFVQKNKTTPPFDGLFAPHFTEEQQNEYGGHREVLKNYSLIENNNDMERSTQDLHDAPGYRTIRKIVRYFYKNPSSLVMGLTFLDGAENKATRFWGKKSPLMSRETYS